MGLKENGKQEIGWFPGKYEDLPCTFRLKGRSFDLTKDNVWLLPCGKCLGCTLARSRDWANRCMLELQYHDVAWFVTLTYDDDHLPVRVVDVESAMPTGEVVEHQTLWYRDYQLFMKRLRKAFPGDHIRYFMAGEYGPKTFRPHYHAIIYGLHLDDIAFRTKSPLGDSYYTSPALESIWGNGFVLLGKVTWETCAYTARYCMKKADGYGRDFYKKLGIEPEFVHMSTGRGIGYQYFEDHPDLFDYAYINVGTDDGGRKFYPPKYFMRLLQEKDPERYDTLTAQRKELAFNALEGKLLQTDLFLDELLHVEEHAKASQIKSLRRNVL